MISRFALLVAIMAIGSTVSLAQSIPRNDFVVTLNPTSLSISKGDTASVQVSITRSKLFKNGNAVFGLSSSDKKGISVTLDANVADSCLLKVSVDALAEPGQYNIIPNCKVQGKTIGTILKLTVNP